MTLTQKTLIYYLSEHPKIVNFRWSHTHSWGSTWSFLFTSIFAYLLLSLLLHLILHLLGRRRPVPLGPIPALHSLSMALISLTIFTGILVSAAAEIRDTRWFWRRTNTTPFQWFLCFPLGTRPSGRVFFWSYIFYLTRFLNTLRTFFAVLRRRNLSFFRLFNHSILITMSFLWLEFSQSFQVTGILLTTSVYSVVYGYRFWTAIGLRSACFPFVNSCQMVLLGCNVICHVGVLLLHFKKGGCNGIGAWGINSVLDAAVLMLFLNFYVSSYLRGRRKTLAFSPDHRGDDVAATVETDRIGCCESKDKDI
ncbi:putative very-long-chain 3-oxoacyl-CoA synthase, Medium-chain acyl-CoA ligase [Helianthus annuus]|uniref:Very-long-chain 3-oxoacyl-CoA synthase, Medium-chain acyl-CoA ligase n=1 Tax=Helianthus annuus TaxID=4232 RepID=A0A9K3E338_HELAN|nr:elongation of fatty acids protein 3-like [Helianthus annuus]KAF5766200.1 putative very-long-chain 3-oxoacyl-CoA synthase, Medium-chain acyl-CoA ligase [Helianthus annuus]KAJ0452634.1 putative very-long-chain 3-oxoacyl-CoA synthase, Medium-chain acyl-CoA ligase [Helianthus annuus]KAJ0474541.1 putative very-long-chain 3-oxoacyl-CoA synthase, Medium-chain acyl-CoA ligase [Helianthus annuus]KAJ0650099.1 putative very-long-chain 3-oxoacyl-CoA synthase, Medium-chain acyl-CoA ligase [Helianthus ann